MKRSALLKHLRRHGCVLTRRSVTLPLDQSIYRRDRSSASAERDSRSAGARSAANCRCQKSVVPANERRVRCRPLSFRGQTRWPRGASGCCRQFFDLDRLEVDHRGAATTLQRDVSGRESRLLVKVVRHHLAIDQRCNPRSLGFNLQLEQFVRPHRRVADPDQHLIADLQAAGFVLGVANADLRFISVGPGRTRAGTERRPDVDARVSA